MASAFLKKALSTTFLQMDSVGGMRQLFLDSRLCTHTPQIPTTPFLKTQQRQLVAEDGIDVLPISSHSAFGKADVVVNYYTSIGSIL